MDILEIRTYPGKSARDCYYAALLAFPKAGFTIWKKRDFGWFAIAKRSAGGQEVTANIMSKPAKESLVEMRINAEHLEEAELKRFADEFFRALQEILGK